MGRTDDASIQEQDSTMTAHRTPGPTIATADGVIIAQQEHIDLTTTRRRWTPVTEADLIAEKRQICGFSVLPLGRWPRGWFDYRLLTLDAELHAQRMTRETTR